MNNTYIQIAVILLTFTITYFYLKNKDKEFKAKSVIDQLKIPIVAGCVTGLIYSFFVTDDSIPTRVPIMLGGSGTIDVFTDYPNF